MRQLIIYGITFCLSIGCSMAQDEGFYLNLKSDTVLAGNIVEVSFVANNVAGQFEAPDLRSLNVVSGPNTSTSMSMINGAVSQHASYSYNIYLEEIGEAVIPPAYLETNEGVLETEPKSIIVLPNPEGIIEQPPSQSGYFEFSFPDQSKMKTKDKEKSGSKKKKRKLKKI